VNGFDKILRAAKEKYSCKQLNKLMLLMLTRMLCWYWKR